MRLSDLQLWWRVARVLKRSPQHLGKIHQIIVSVKAALKTGGKVMYVDLSAKDYQVYQCDYRDFVELMLPTIEKKQ